MTLTCSRRTTWPARWQDQTGTTTPQHVTVALVAGDGGSVTWPLNSGLLRAKEYLLTGERVSPAVAVETGMANRVVALDALMVQARTFAHPLAAMPWQAIQDTKHVLNQHLRQAAVGALGLGLAAESQSHDTAECRAVPEQFRTSKAPRAAGSVGSEKG